MTPVDHARAAALSLAGEADLDPLVERVRDARLVLIGDASHGTHEFYAWRAELTRRLITERGYGFVAVEQDDLDARRVNVCVCGGGDGSADAAGVLEGLREWPSWLWANTETARFARWLRERNKAVPADRRVGWHGLDVYPMWTATKVVLDYLREHAPALMNPALDGNAAGEAMVPETHIGPVVERLVGELGTDQILGCQFTHDAPGFFETMVRAGDPAWNQRDRHWSRVLSELLTAYGPGSHGVVWAHNTHLGDTRGVAMGAMGLVNLGQLAREQHGPEDVVIVGMAGGTGQVLAARQRGGPMEILDVPLPHPWSIEALLGRTGLDAALFIVDRERDRDAAWLTTRVGQRAIGVAYDPGHDHRQFVPTVIGARYDALLWFAETTPVDSLHDVAARRGELPLLRSSTGRE